MGVSTRDHIEAISRLGFQILTLNPNPLTPWLRDFEILRLLPGFRRWSFRVSNFLGLGA